MFHVKVTYGGFFTPNMLPEEAGFYSFATDGSPSSFVESPIKAHAFAVTDSAGSIYESSAVEASFPNSTIIRYDGNAYNTFVQTTDTFADIEIGSNGDIFAVVGDGTEDSIRRFAPDGSDLGTFFAQSSLNITELALGPSGDLLALTMSGLIRIDPMGNATGPVGDNLGFPIDFAIEPNGNMHVLSLGNRVTTLAPNGDTLGSMELSTQLQSIDIAGDRLLLGGAGFNRDGFVDAYTLDGTFLNRLTSNLPGLPEDIVLVRVPEPGVIGLLMLAVTSALVVRRRMPT